MAAPEKLPPETYQEKTFAPISPPTLFKPHLPSTLGLTKVKVIPDLDNVRLYNITWPAQIGAVKYIVYASPHPISGNKNKFVEVGNSILSAEFEIPIMLPHDVVFYFWVGYETPQGAIKFISDEPAFTTNDTAFDVDPLSEAVKRDIIHDGDAKWRAEEIRRRHLAIVENGGEMFFLYIRRMYGLPCICIEEDSTTGASIGRVTPQSTPFFENFGKDIDRSKATEPEIVEAKNPNYQGTYRCEQCFGTGIAGGYFPKLVIKVRYGSNPKRLIRVQEEGIEFQHTFNSHTIWHPRLKEKDVLVRVRNGERFVVKEPSAPSWRGIVTHQEFNATGEAGNSMIYRINDAAITKALEFENAFNIAKFNWAIWQ